MQWVTEQHKNENEKVEEVGERKQNLPFIPNFSIGIMVFFLGILLFCRGCNYWIINLTVTWYATERGKVKIDSPYPLCLN